MSYPNAHGQVENGMVVNAFPNPYNDPILKMINDCYEREDMEYQAMFGDERWAHYERYCKAHLEDYLRWTWENREGEE